MFMKLQPINSREKLCDGLCFMLGYWRIKLRPWWTLRKEGRIA